VVVIRIRGQVRVLSGGMGEPVVVHIRIVVIVNFDIGIEELAGPDIIWITNNSVSKPIVMLVRIVVVMIQGLVMPIQQRLLLLVPVVPLITNQGAILVFVLRSTVVVYRRDVVDSDLIQVDGQRRASSRRHLVILRKHRRNRE